MATNKKGRAQCLSGRPRWLLTLIEYGTIVSQVVGVRQVLSGVKCYIVEKNLTRGTIGPRLYISSLLFILPVDKLRPSIILIL